MERNAAKRSYNLGSGFKGTQSKLNECDVGMSHALLSLCPNRHHHLQLLLRAFCSPRPEVKFWQGNRSPRLQKQPQSALAPVL
eukprot:757382-Amphidinium_carterae.1